MIWILIIIVMTMMGAVASLFFKKASGGDGIVKIITNPNLYIGGFIYVLAALLNIYVLRYMAYSVVLPMTSLTYIWTMIISYFILKEKITAKKMAGVACIVLGAILIAGS
jgi:drug/metabolite transporter (DMT)-like permease